MSEFNHRNEVGEVQPIDAESNHGEVSPDIESRNKQGLEDSEKKPEKSNPEGRIQKKESEDSDKNLEGYNNYELPDADESSKNQEQATKGDQGRTNGELTNSNSLNKNTVESTPHKTIPSEMSELEDPQNENRTHTPEDIYRAKQQLPDANKPLVENDLDKKAEKENQFTEAPKQNEELTNKSPEHNQYPEPYKTTTYPSEASELDEPPIEKSKYMASDGELAKAKEKLPEANVPLKEGNFDNKDKETSINIENPTFSENFDPNRQYGNLSEYMNAHNYGIDDYEKYSKDPQWQDLYNKAYPDSTNHPDLKERQAEKVDKAPDNIEIIPNIDYNDYNGNVFSEGKLNNHYDRQSLKDAADISPEENISLQRYTGDGYRDINKSLYDPDFRPSSDLKANQIESDIKNISDCLDRKEIPYDTKMYRGVSDMSDLFGQDAKTLTPKELNEKYSGSYFQNDGFTSASTDKDIAKRFAGTWDGGLLEMNVPKGANVMCMGEVGLYKNGEKEVLLQKGTVCRIDSVGEKDGQLYVKTTAVGR